MKAFAVLALAAFVSAPALSSPALAQKNACLACHAVDKKLVGPSLAEIARRHAGKVDYLAGKIRAGGAGVWGPIPMPAQTLPDADLRVLATWLANGANR